MNRDEEIILKAEIHDLISNMLECLLNKPHKTCKFCACVDACSSLTESVMICRSRKIREHKSCIDNPSDPRS